MFISLQTYQGFQITIYSVIEVTKFLLNQGVEFVPTERFRQDPVEEYFGNQRKLGRQCDNPDLAIIQMCCTFRGQSHVHLGTQKIAETKVKHRKVWWKTNFSRERNKKQSRCKITLKF